MSLFDLNLPKIRSKFLSITLINLFLLSNCSFQDSEFTVETGLVQNIFGLKRLEPPAPLTTQGLESATGPQSIQLARLNTKAIANLTLIEVANGKHTYSTSTRQTVTIDNGTIVRTQGLGQDLLTLRNNRRLALRPDQSTVRVHKYLDGNLGIVSVTFVCVQGPAERSQGRENGRVFGIVSVNEDCRNDRSSYTNRYSWIASSNRIWRIRQWINPEIEYLAVAFPIR